MILSFDFRVALLIALHTLWVGAVAGGCVFVQRTHSRRRWLGLLLVTEGLGAIGLLTWMSSRYWFGNQGIIAIGPSVLLRTVSSVLVPVAIGTAVALAVGYAIVHAMRSQKWWAGVGALLVLVPIVLAGGATTLVSLSEIKLQTPRSVDMGVLRVANGFAITVYLNAGLTNPTSMAFGPDGRLYVCTYDGVVWSVPDNGGVGGTPQRYSNQRVQEPVGLAWHGNDLYVASHGKVSILSDLHGTGHADYRSDVVTGLPSAVYHQHSNEGLAFGLDGRLYFPVGSTTDSETETYRYASSILSVNPDGSDLHVFATGVRNPYALAFNAAGDLFGGDNSADVLVPAPEDELNFYVQGGDYGFSRFFGVPPPASGTRGPVAVFPPHTSPDGIAFYEGHQFPDAYRDNAFVTMYVRGRIARVQLAKTAGGNYLSNVETFASGFENPLDIKAGPDGSLYVADFETGVIYRISYVGGTGGQS